MNTPQSTPLALAKEFKGVTFPISPAHPAADLWGWIEEELLQKLANDIAANGQIDEILRLPDGRIIDGRNRELACRIAGVEPRYKTVEASDQKAIELVISKNEYRRHDTPSQLAMIGAQLATMKRGRPKENASCDGITQSKAAEMLRVSPTTIQRATRVLKKAPELVKPVRDGKLDVNTAAEIAKQSDITADDHRKIATADDPKALAEAVLKRSSSEAVPSKMPEQTALAAVVKDERGRVIPQSLLAIFEEGWAVVKQTRAAHRDAVQRLRDASMRPSGRGVAPLLPNLESDYKKIAQDVAASVPWCCCPHVDATGEHHLGGNCKVCVGNCGWLSRHNWHTLGDNMKAAIDKYAEAKPKVTASDPAPADTLREAGS